MNNESNPYLRKLDAINEARMKWEASDWLLSFLRTNDGKERKKPSDDELLQWSQQLH